MCTIEKDKMDEDRHCRFDKDSNTRFKSRLIFCREQEMGLNAIDTSDEQDREISTELKSNQAEKPTFNSNATALSCSLQFFYFVPRCLSIKMSFCNCLSN